MALSQNYFDGGINAVAASNCGSTLAIAGALTCTTSATVGTTLGVTGLITASVGIAVTSGGINIALGGLLSSANGITSAITGSSSSNFVCKATTAGTECGMQFQDGTTAKWALYKETTNVLNVYDFSVGFAQLTFTAGTSSSGTVVVNLTTAASNTSSGALQVRGGVGITGALYVGGVLIAGTGSTFSAASGSCRFLVLGAGTGDLGILQLGSNSVAAIQIYSTATASLTFNDNVNSVNFLTYTAGAVGASVVNIACSLDATTSSAAGTTLSGGLAVAKSLVIGGALTVNSAVLIKSNTTLTNGAATTSPTLGATGPAGATTPTKWIPINDNGTTRYLPAW